MGPRQIDFKSILNFIFCIEESLKQLSSYLNIFFLRNIFNYKMKNPFSITDWNYISNKLNYSKMKF